MPIYEFHSPDTNKIYSFFARSLSYASKVPRCPDDPMARMERVVSKFAFTGRAKEKTDSPATEDLDPRMERVMAEMERDMAGMDEDNPDPRALGRMMRKMTEATGQKMPGEMEQMISRLEAGEDPEKLEEEFGDAFEGMDFPGMDGGEEGESTGRATKSRPRPAERDPALYEFSDYL
ncbi:MAG: cytochrome C [bacterium]